MHNDEKIIKEKIIEGLEFTKAMITFNPLTGEDIEPENLNEENRTSYDALVGAIDLLKARTPIHIHKEYPEHDWETYEDGNIDESAMSYGFHNGPYCKRCGYSFCVHCKPNGWSERPCVIDYYQCPKCERRISKGIKFCSDRGQEVEWNE